MISTHALESSRLNLGDPAKAVPVIGKALRPCSIAAKERAIPSNVERLNGGAFRSARSVSLNTRPRASLIETVSEVSVSRVSAINCSASSTVITRGLIRDAAEGGKSG